MPPVTIYTPQAEGEMSNPGVSSIIDTTSNFIVDTSGNFIVDTGSLFTPIPATIYVENDSV
jgi:hypothetical protein